MNFSDIYEDLESIQNSLETIQGESKLLYHYLNRLNGINLFTSFGFLEQGHKYLYNEQRRMESMKDIYNNFKTDIDTLCNNYYNSLDQHYFPMSINPYSNLSDQSDPEHIHIYVKEQEKQLQSKESTFHIQSEDYSKFSSSLQNIIDEYKVHMNQLEEESKTEYSIIKDNLTILLDEIQKKNNIIKEEEIIPLDKEPKFIYRDGHISDRLNMTTLKQYSGCYLLKEYHSDRRTDKGDIYIDRDCINEEYIIQYMTDNEELIENIEKMSYETKCKFLDDLDFFELPVKSKFVGLLGHDEGNRVMDGWKNRRWILFNDKYVPSITGMFKNSGRLDTLYNNSLLKDINYDSNTRTFSINLDIPMYHGDLVDNFLFNSKEWNDQLLVVEQLTFDDILEDMKYLSIQLTDQEQFQLRNSWMSVRSIYVNHQYHHVLDEYLRDTNQFESFYCDFMDQEHLSENGSLYVDISIKSIEAIENYFLNNQKWDLQILQVSKLNYFDLIDELELIGIELNDIDRNMIQELWMNIRYIYLNNHYYDFLNNYLKKEDEFVYVYNDNIDTEQSDKNGKFHVNLSYNYGDIILDYFTNNMHLNDSILDPLVDVNYQEFINGFYSLRINLSDEEKIEIRKRFFSFVQLSTILDDEKYDPILKNWVGTNYDWECIYRASEHEYSAQAFHGYCDHVGPTLIIIKSRNGFIFGGYTEQSWQVYDNNNSTKKFWKKDKNAFLFTLYNARLVPPTRYKSIYNGGICCKQNFGPVFGDEDYDLFIPNECNKNTCEISNDGTIGFDCHPIYKQSLYVNSVGLNWTSDFLVDDYEVYCRSQLQLSPISLSNEELNKIRKWSFSFIDKSTIIKDSFYDKYLKIWLGIEYKWKCIYRASEHKYTAESFHQYCDNQGPTLIVIKSTDGWIFGGYTAQSWNENEIKFDPNSFIFTLENAFGIGPTQYNINQNTLSGIKCDPKWGPTFGSDIIIRDHCDTEFCIINNDGNHSYQCNPTYKCSLFVNTDMYDKPNCFYVDEYEVFCHSESVL